MNSLFERAGIGSNLGLLLHHATRKAAASAALQSDRPSEHPLAWVAPAFRLAHAGARIALPASTAHADAGATPPILDALARRYSTRAYTEQPLTLDEIAQFLRWAYAAPAADGGAPSQDDYLTLVRPVLVALRVDGLAPGAYHVDMHDLALVRLDADAAQIPHLLKSACFQTEFGTAAALLLMVGSVATALERYGDRGYRYMLLGNGMQLQRNGIACAALGLGGCITGSFCQDSWERWLGFDGFHASMLNAYALGHATAARVLAAAMSQAGQGDEHAGA
jgi:SagB-type dehydrogenase family enzyme